jgi:putative endonuclease
VILSPPDRRRGAAHDVGVAAEARAAIHLERLGFTILARNFRAAGGELDLVGRRGDLLTFVEVRARRRAGDALESVTALKRRRLTAAAAAFLARHPELGDLACRFDVVAVAGDEVTVVEDAFRAEQA